MGTFLETIFFSNKKKIIPYTARTDALHPKGTIYAPDNIPG
jgi:hypothetical protein